VAILAELIDARERSFDQAFVRRDKILWQLTYKEGRAGASAISMMTKAPPLNYLPILSFLEGVGRDGAGRLIVEVLATDAFALLEPSAKEALADPVQQLRDAIGQSDEILVSPEGLPIWMECFRVLQAAEIWASHGDWITRVKPNLGPGIRERFAWASTVGPAEVSKAGQLRQSIQRRLYSVLCAGEMLCLPTSPRIAPLLGSPTSDVENTVRSQAMCLLCIAGLGGLPQIHLPVAKLDGCPFGVSLIGPRGSDMDLLRTTVSLSELSEEKG
jgi:amidase